MTYTCTRCGETAHGCGSRQKRAAGEQEVVCIDCGGGWCLCCCEFEGWLHESACVECAPEARLRRKELESQVALAAARGMSLGEVEERGREAERCIA
jgi:hypothetical protein